MTIKSMEMNENGLRTVGVLVRIVVQLNSLVEERGMSGILCLEQPRRGRHSLPCG